MGKRFVSFAMMFILLSSLTLAIGVSPIRKVVDFSSGATEELFVKISNTQEKNIRAVVYARGELSPYIGIKDSLLLVGAGSEASAGYVLTLPKAFEKPGIHKGELVVMEYPESFGTGAETAVSTTASVVSELWVRVPYPGKYAEGTLHINAGNVDEMVPFVISLMNFGKEDIAAAKATIKILGATYEEIAQFETTEIGLKTGEQGQLTGAWLANVHPGRYHAIAEIAYDNKKFILEENFEVGNLYIAVERIDIKEFSLGQVAAMDIFLTSEWNEQILQVYGEITVLDTKGSTLETFKTASIDMPAQGEGVLKAYWDTQGLQVGPYTLRLLIHYSGKVTERLVDAEVTIDSIRTSLGTTAQVVAGKGSGKESLLTILVIILIAINIIWFVYFMRKKK